MFTGHLSAAISATGDRLDAPVRTNWIPRIFFRAGTYRISAAMHKRFVLLMSSLALVDLAVTGIFIAVSGRLDVVGPDIVANVGILGAVNAAGAWLLFRPIGDVLLGRRPFSEVERRIAALPAMATLWAAVLTLGYCAVIFSLGVFVPADANLDGISKPVLAAAIGWFLFLYVLYYGFFTYFLISDFTNNLKAVLFFQGHPLPASHGRIQNKLIVVFAVLALLPSSLIILDLTVFSGLRTAQGLSLTQTIFLDLFASVFLILISLIFVTRSLVRPIRALTDAMEASRSGQLDTGAPVTSSDELGMLSERFNEMIEGLRERNFIRQTFGRYVPDKIASLLLANKGVVQPRLTTATILYLDIEDFTGISENRSPESVLEMLNAFFGVAIEAVQRTGGVANQFHGDAMLVTYNVPVADPHHADNALSAAAEIQRAVAETTFAGTRLRVRIGINTGQVVAGAVGGEDQLSYTVYGDTVNLAARLETLNKELGTRVLVSASTVAALSRSFPLEPKGHVTVRGKRNLVSLYALRVTEPLALGEPQPGAAVDRGVH